jgi:adenosylcobyric acid synthase
MLQDLTGIPTVAVLPMWLQHGLPEEDGVFDDRSTVKGEVRLTIAVIAYPRISNLDEFQPLKNIPGVRLVWVRSPVVLAGLSTKDWIILPGSKSTVSDLTWLRQQGLDAAIVRHAGQGGVVLGVCGGLQMLGEELIDTHGVDGNAPGLGLLPLMTLFEHEKTVRHTQITFCNSMLGSWLGLAGVRVSGYEIHQGVTCQHPAMAQKVDVARMALPGGLGWQNMAGNVLGVYLHGLFEDSDVLKALFGSLLNGPVPTLDAVFEGLADFIAHNFDSGVLDALCDHNLHQL